MSSRSRFRTFLGSLRTQLFLALLLPATVAVITLGFVAVTTANESARDREVTSVLSMSQEIGVYLDALSVESRAAFGLSGTSYAEAATKTDEASDQLFAAIDASKDTLPKSLRDLAVDLNNQGRDQMTTVRSMVGGNALPPAGTLGTMFYLRAMTTVVPQDFASDISNGPVRDQLNALGHTWMLNSRLETEAILADLWFSGNERVSAADVAAAIRETDVAVTAAELALKKVDTANNIGAWSEDVIEARLEFSVMNGTAITTPLGQFPLKFDDQDRRGTYVTQAANRVIEVHSTTQNLIADATGLADSQSAASTRQIVVTVALAILVLALAVFTMLLLTRRVVNPVVSLVSMTRKRAKDLPNQLASIERGVAPEAFTPITVPTAGPELREFAGSLNDLVGTAIDLAAKEAQQRAAVVGMLRTVAHREAALVNRQLELLDKYERHEVDPVFLSRLFNLDHVTTQMRRMCDSLLVLAGASPVRRTTPPLSLVDVVRGASSQIQQYSRVDLDVWYDPRVHGHKVSDLTLLLAELLDNATKYSHPDTRVTVTFTRGVDAALVTIADQGIGFDNMALSTAQELVDATDPDHFAMFDRLGLQTVARLCQRTGTSVSFTGGTDVAGTSVSVRIPDSLLADPGAGVGVRLASSQPGDTFDDAVNRPASMTLYGQQL